MKSWQSLFLGFVSLLMGSCVSPINCRKQFTVFKEPVYTTNSSRPLNIHGIFVSINDEGAFYLYNNGLSKTISSSVSLNQSFWLNPEIEIVKLLNDDNYFKKEVWGHYQIINDTIVIQTFGLANDQICRRSVYETKGIILNDTTIKVFSDYSYWFNNQFIKEPNIYRFYKTELKPDSTLAWFNKKWWYKRNLHESRK